MSSLQVREMNDSVKMTFLAILNSARKSAKQSEGFIDGALHPMKCILRL